MKVFEIAGVIFNANNVCTAQKVTLKNEETNEGDKAPASVSGIQITTIAGGVNFTYASEKERDDQFKKLLLGLKNL